MDFELGLVEVADGVHAYLQPDGSWGWSNAALVVGSDTSLLVDTLFDLHLTQRMLDEMAPLTDHAPIAAVANTHANGDHCYGNQLVGGGGVRFYASKATAQEITDLPPSALAAMVSALPPGPLTDFLDHSIGRFDLTGIEVPPITDPFAGCLTIDVGGRSLELREVGPAHTEGDVIGWLPESRVLCAGDILFIGGTPIMWSGPIGNWIAACELIEQLEPEVVVPGHGPLTDARGAKDVGDYLRFVADAVVERHAAGVEPLDAWLDIDAMINGTRFGNWSDRERLVVTVLSAWREVAPGYEPPDLLTMFGLMADDFARRSAPTSAPTEAAS